MEMYFGVGGELLTPLNEMLDVDIKLSLELDLELKDPLCGLGGSGDDWGGWGSLRTSPTLDIFGEKDSCVMVSPEAVMPFIKREVKQEPVAQFSPIKSEEEEEEEETSLLYEQDQYRAELDGDNANEDEEEDEEVEEEEEEEDEEDDDDEEEIVPEIKIQPKERNLWNSILTKPTVIKSENVGISYQSRPKTEIITKPAVTHHQNVRVLHSSKSRNTESSNSRSILVKRIKANINGYPKPAYSYSCLIAMALKNSLTGSLPVSEIYNFMCEHFPYFKSAPAGWKNSVRHNLSLNKCFEKIEKGGSGGGSRKGCLWAMNPAKISKMDDEVAKWSKKDPAAIRRSMKYPEELEKLERGDLKIGARRDSYDSGAEADSTSDSESEEVPPSLKRFDSRLSSQESNDVLDLPDEMYEELGLLEEVMSSDTDGEIGPQVKRVRLGLDHFPRQAVRPV